MQNLYLDRWIPLVVFTINREVHSIFKAENPLSTAEIIANAA